MTSRDLDLGPIATLYRDGYRAALAYARRLVGDADAEDVAQEAFLRVIKYRGATPDGLTVRFVCAVVRNVAHTHNGAGIGRAACAINAAALAEPERTRRRSAPGLSAWIAQELGDLPGSQYDAVVLMELHGLSEVEAARVLNLSRSAIGSKRRTALETLRRKAEVRTAKRPARPAAAADGRVLRCA